ncbi:hypothetical protein K8R30_02590 [archaeon]|nr:hypothetical protein [archaeon]
MHINNKHTCLLSLIAILFLCAMGVAEDWDDTSKITILGNFSDQKIDENNNGLYDYLIVEFDVDVLKEGDYRIRGAKKEDRMRWVDYNGYLTEGIHRISFKFSGINIYMDRSYGESLIRGINMHEDGNNEPFFVKLENFYSFDDIYYEEFEKPPVIPTGNFSDYVVDEDENDLYEYLVIEVELEAFEKGNYKLTGFLKDLNIQPQFEINIEKGINIVELRYSGEDILDKEINGPYRFDGLSLEDSDRNLIWSLGDGDGKHEWMEFPLTEKYYYHDFEREIEDKGTPTNQYKDEEEPINNHKEEVEPEETNEILNKKTENVITLYQKEENSQVSNVLDAKDNNCINDKCKEDGILSSIIQWFKGLFGFNDGDDKDKDSRYKENNEVLSLNIALDNNDFGFCSSFKNEDYLLACYLGESVYERDSDSCNKMKDKEMKDKCFYYSATYDSSSCKLISDDELEESCMATVPMGENIDKEIEKLAEKFEKISNDDEYSSEELAEARQEFESMVEDMEQMKEEMGNVIMDSFYMGIGIRNNESRFCDRILGDDAKDMCYSIVGEYGADLRACPKIDDVLEQAQCYTAVAKDRKDPAICNSIRYGSFYRHYHDYFEWELQVDCLDEVYEMTNDDDICSYATRQDVEERCISYIF